MEELREYLEKLGEALYLHTTNLVKAEKAESSVDYLESVGVLKGVQE
jgi:hypothetical protein